MEWASPSRRIARRIWYVYNYYLLLHFQSGMNLLTLLIFFHFYREFFKGGYGSFGYPHGGGYGHHG